MAEKQNCSDVKVTTSTARRRGTLPTLSRILRSQASSFQHRAGQVKKKPASGPKAFLLKVLVGCGAVYLSAFLGVWGEPEESTKMFNKLRDTVKKMGNEDFLSDDAKNGFIEKFNKSTSYFKNHLEAIPEELKAYYDKTEQYVNDLIKGKKS